MKKTAKIPKMIWGIVIAIFIAVVGYFSPSAFWFWTSLEIAAGLLVAGGCWGEWYLFKNPADENDESAKHLHHSREVRCIIAVAIGVTVEFAALTHSIPEAMQLEKDVAQIGSINAQLVADNLVSRSNVAALELQVIDAKTNIAQIDWRNKPIYAFSAKATVIVRPLEPVENLENLPRNSSTWLLDSRLRLPKEGNEKPALLTLGIAEQLADNSWQAQSALVNSDNFSRSVEPNWDGKVLALRYDIFFDEHSDNFQIGTLKPSELSGIELLLPLRCEVLAGKIEMVIDGGLTNRTFEIPPQKSLVHQVSSFETKGLFSPLNFSAKALSDATAAGAFSKVETNVDFLNPPK